MARLGLILYALWCCAIRWPAIALKLHTGDKADKNELADHWWGFSDPDLKWDTEGGASHRAIDFLVEWVRLSPQRAAKLGSFVVLALSALVIFTVVLIVIWNPGVGGSGLRICP